MNPDSTSWNTSGWRNSNHAASSLESSHIDLTSSYASHHPSRPPPPHVSAPSAINLSAPPSSILAHQHHHNAWIRKSCEEGPLPRLTEPSAASTRALSSSSYQTTPNDGRHYSPQHGGQQLANPSPPHQKSTGTWRLHHADRRSSLSHPPDAPPLTLHIPRSQDLSRSSPTTEPAREPLAYGGSSHPALTPSTLLPSFASLQERANRSEDADGPDIAPMSSRLSCYHCTKLKPLVQDIATAVAELDENVQAYCGASITSGWTINDVNDSPIRAAQWVLERLHYAKHNLREASKRDQGGSYQHQTQQSHLSDGLSRNLSPHNPLKRPAEPWDRDDGHGLKRPRSGASGEQLPSLTTRECRQDSIGFGHRELRQGFSPAPSESAPGSAHPRQSSPTLTARLNTRALPSPSSLVYPQSAAPSLPPPASGQSVGSPALSYQQAPSVHTTSTNSATSAHIADLQHQITLKSLALQTLQTEYASLLQKLQRERVKSQAIEKKTSVADQEVNELTTKNEELAEQVKTLETQLEDSESKREAERSEAAREKDQWGRMLEMGGRLQAKIDGDRQKLLEEKTGLLQRIHRLEALQGHHSGQHSAPSPDRAGRDAGQIPPSAADSNTHAALTAHMDGGVGRDEAAGLRQEVASLTARISALRLALEGARRQNSELHGQARRFFEHSTSFSDALERAISEDDANAKQLDSSAQRTTSSRSTPARLQPAWQPPVPPLLTPRPGSRSKQLPSARADTLEVYKDGKITTASIAEVARAASPGPEELGIHLTPSTSTPEELIKALGPVPAPVPSLQFAARDKRLDPAKERHPDLVGGTYDMPSSRAIQTNRRPAESSPRSYHSSPGELVEDRSSNASSANRSTDAYASDPERHGLAGSRTAQAVGQFTPLNLETTKSQESGNYTWVPAMPPPPRPDPPSLSQT